MKTPQMKEVYGKCLAREEAENLQAGKWANNIKGQLQLPLNAVHDCYLALYLEIIHK